MLALVASCQCRAHLLRFAHPVSDLFTLFIRLNCGIYFISWLSNLICILFYQCGRFGYERSRTFYASSPQNQRNQRSQVSHRKSRVKLPFAVGVHVSPKEGVFGAFQLQRCSAETQLVASGQVSCSLISPLIFNSKDATAPQWSQILGVHHGRTKRQNHSQRASSRWKGHQQRVGLQSRPQLFHVSFLFCYFDSSYAGFPLFDKMNIF